MRKRKFSLMTRFWRDRILTWGKGLRVNYDFLWLGTVLLMANWAYLSKGFFPIHDTLEVFTFFHYFYSEWFIRGEIPQWFPHATYGLPTNFYQFRNVTPVYYVFMALGRWWHVMDAIFLFKISVIAEQAVFLLGLYKLSRYLFRRRLTVVIVCLAGAGSIIWHSAINFNFRLYAMFPLVVYYLLMFFERRRDGALWLAGIFCLVGGMGVTIYFFGLWAFVYTLLAVALLMRHKDRFKAIFQLSTKNVLLCLAFVTLVALSLLYIKSSIHSLTLISKERDPSGVNALSTFLNYGELPGFGSIFRALIFPDAYVDVGVPYDNTLYMGLVPVFFLFWSFFHVRAFNYFVFLGLAVVLVWLSFGGVFAALAYRFPALGYYRHIGHVYSLVKILLLLCAGYGLDHFLAVPLRKKITGTAWAFVMILVIFDLFINQRGHLLSPEKGLSQIPGLWASVKPGYLWSWGQGTLKYVVLLGAVLSAIIGFRSLRHRQKAWMPLVAKALLVLFALGDVYIFQQIVFADIPKIPESHYDWLASAHARVADYQKVRLLEPRDPVQQDAYQLVMLSNPTAKYVSAYNFIQLDRCDPGFRVDLASQGVLELVAMPDVKRAIVGCHYPKMRLVPHALFSNDVIDVAKVAAVYDAFKDIVVVPQAPDTERVLKLGPQKPDPRNAVHVDDFAPNQVTAAVSVYDEQGSWLVYADAFNPHWQAFVDGKRVPIHRAYRAFKAVFLDQGKHTVVFEYGQAPRYRSAALALAGLAAGLGLAALFMREVFRAP
jgi:hypothetical protein